MHKSGRIKSPLAIAILGSLMLAACGSLQAAPVIVFGKAAMATQQTAKAVAALAKGTAVDPSDDPEKAPSTQILATLEELAPNFTDDKAISLRVHERLVHEAELRHLVVSVTTVEGVVTLSGIVASETTRAQAIELARRVRGVKQVNDQFVVDQKLS